MNRKLAICTPVYGSIEAASVSWGYHMAVCKLLRQPDVTFLEGRLYVNVDLVRARSRAVRLFLETTSTDLLFWDEDVVPRDVSVINAMIHSGKDIISVPYPRKHIDWNKLAAQVRDEDEQNTYGRQSTAELEGAGLDWPLRALDQKVENGMARVSEVGLGFTLIRRHALEMMCDKYRDELLFHDKMDGKSFPTVALFQLMIYEGELYSEDYSFCRRWRDMGGDLWTLVDPAKHIGAYAFGRGVVEG